MPDFRTPPSEGTFTEAELRAIRDALADAHVVLGALNGGTVHHPSHGVAEALELTDELVRLEVALMLVTSN